MSSGEAYDLACVVHLHSLYSDGTGTVPEIARAAAASDVDVVLLTDHDSLEAMHRGEDGEYDGGVLVLVGEEVSPRGGNHYLAFGIEEEIDWHDRSPAEICDAVRDAGGFGFAAHPWSSGSPRFKRARGMPFADLGACDGVELWSWVTDTAERLPSLRAVARFIVTPHRVVDHPPSENLAAWDRMCAERRVSALGGIDAHQFGKRLRGGVVLRLMGYARSFRHLRTHVLASERSREGVFEALREGRAYLAMDSIAPARGFRFFADGGGDRIEMGAEAPAGTYDLQVRAPRPASLRLLRDGSQIGSTKAPVLAQRVSEPGVYRVEARLPAYGRERTWIVSNPIYLRG